MPDAEKSEGARARNVQEIVRQGLESGRLPSLIQLEEELALIWSPPFKTTRLSVLDVYIAHDSILFYTADYPYEYHKAMHAADKFSSFAASVGIDVYDWKYKQSIQLF